MKFTYKCLAVTHTSGRVTLTLLELPFFTVHSTSLDAARFELTLALDDRISRAHPKHLWRFCSPGSGELDTLKVPVLPLHEAGEVKRVPLVLDVLERPAQANHTELRVLSVAARYWLKEKGAALHEQAATLMGEQLREAAPDVLLRLRRDGKAELVDVELDVAPLKLASLRRGELRLDERPPPAPPDEEPGPEDEQRPRDDWEDEPEQKRAKGGQKPRVATPTLQRLGVKWNPLAKDGAFPKVFGRDALAEQLRAHLTARGADPLVLLGDSGVGKTAVLQEAVRRIVAHETEQHPAPPIFQLDASRLIAGQGGFGDWQRQTIDSFVEAQAAGAVLYLGRLIDLLDAGRSAHSDDNVAQLLLPTLASREVAVVAEATPSEWARLRDRNQSFARLFSPITVDEPSVADEAAIVTQLAAHEARARRVTLGGGAVDEVRALVRRFMPYGSPLGSAIAFLRRLLDAAGHAQPATLTRADVVRRFSVESGVPEELLRDDLPLKSDEVRAFLSARVMGQGAAVARVAQVVSVIKANLADPRRPVATLFFAGPTGVGKTELTKALAERIYGSKERMVRLDMGEYAGPDALWRLIGDGQGDGFLTTAVRRQPFSVVLLDEIEKAHPAVFDTLLSVLGEGRLTDGRGRLTDFRSTVIVMTSNLGAQTLRARVGFDGADAETGDAERRAHYLAEARRFFRPELFNRLDDVVVFESLSRANLGTIVTRELAKVAARPGFGRLDVELAPSQPVLEALADWGFDPRYGARPLKRALEQRLVVPAAAHLAAHRPSGATRLEVSVEDGRLSFSSQPRAGRGQGAPRAALLALCERAAVLRAEVRTWMAAPFMLRLRESQRLFERVSRSPSYWLDRDLADGQSRRAADAKGLWEAFDAVRAQAESAEDLACEAYLAHAGHIAEELELGIGLVREAFTPLTERLFASTGPRLGSATLTLVPDPRQRDDARWLLHTYVRWVQLRKLSHDITTLVPGSKAQLEAAEKARKEELERTSRDEVVRVLRQQGSASAARVYAQKHGVPMKEAERVVAALKERHEHPVPLTHVWVKGEPSVEDWQALSLHVRGEALPMLLSAEHGAHRFGTGRVKVRFTPDTTGRENPGSVEELAVAMPGLDIRRVSLQREGQEYGLLRDLRTNTSHRVTAEGVDLAEVLAAWVRHRVFGAKELQWT